MEANTLDRTIAAAQMILSFTSSPGSISRMDIRPATSEINSAAMQNPFHLGFVDKSTGLGFGLVFNRLGVCVFAAGGLIRLVG